MQYMILIYGEEDASEGIPSAEELAPWIAYDNKLREAGVFVAGDALMPTTTATTVTMGADGFDVTDGPFAETREALGGYYLIECADLDQAVEWAKGCPAVHYGRIEVRPVMVFNQ